MLTEETGATPPTVPEWISTLDVSGPEWARQLIRETCNAATFGADVYRNGVVAYGNRADREPGSEAWMHVLYPGLPTDVVSTLEKDFGLRYGNPDVMRVGLRKAIGYKGPVPPIPEHVRGFLRCFNGVRLFGRHLSLYGVRTAYGGNDAQDRQPLELVDRNIFHRPHELAADKLVVGGYPWDGSILCASVSTICIERMDPSGSQRLNAWSDLATFLDEECRRLAAFFNDRGKLLDPMVPTVPKAES
jgi:hypothetical protein